MSEGRLRLHPEEIERRRLVLAGNSDTLDEGKAGGICRRPASDLEKAR